MPKVPPEQLHLRFAPSSFSSDELSPLEHKASDGVGEARRTSGKILRFPASRTGASTSQASARADLIDRLLQRVSKFK